MSNESDDLRPEYDFDFSKGVRGKHYKKYIESSNEVCSIAISLHVFPMPHSVNAACNSRRKPAV